MLRKMSSSSVFQNQLASIMEILVNSAVSDICRLVDDGAAVLHVEISRGRSEIEELRLKLRLLEGELSSARRAEGRAAKSVAIQCAGLGEGGLEFVAVKHEKLEDPDEEEEEEDPRVSDSCVTASAQFEWQRCVEGWPASVSDQASSTEGWSSELLPVPSPQKLRRRRNKVTGRLTKEDRNELVGRVDHRVVVLSKVSPKHENVRGQNYPQLSSTDVKDARQQGFFGSPWTSGENGEGSSPDVYEVEYKPALYKQDELNDGHGGGTAGVDLEDQQTEFGKVEQAVTAPCPPLSDLTPHGQSTRSTVSLPLPSSRTGPRSYVCDQCGRGFSHMHVLKRHHIVHSGLKPHVCGNCGKRFALQDSLRRHQRIHTGERPYGCSLCGKRFTQRTHLNIHMSVHTGVRPFTCAVCGKSFSQTHALRRHMRVHVVEEIPFYHDAS
ncbi:zinc finger protein 221-like isoform X2 [Denticeps clupeoides]|uniref:zinc finger protein 221-like isoform X2 n=1 Tax=Denticeps clupeoides TaxID=299321 RepID=UPI0010A53CC4|nr:zinc finger protein 221-like isoform X2 [Denticeps clupeoides]